MFKLPEYTAPNFSAERFISCPDVTTERAGRGYIPENFYATTIYPEYFKINGEWKLIKGSRMDCSVVIKDGEPHAVEMRNIREGDEVVVGRTDDGSCGVFVHTDGFTAARRIIRALLSERGSRGRPHIRGITTGSMISCATTGITAR